MSNKNLLNEGTIRRFMKLAEIDSLANPFVDRINENEEEIYEAEEDELAGMEGDASAEEAGDEEMPDDMDMDMDMDDEGMDDEGMEGEDDPMAEIGTAIADAVSELLQGMVDDGTLEISQGEDTDEVDLEAEPDGGEEMDVADAGIEVSDEEPEDAEAEIVAEVARRVTKRLLASR
jgi:hypothetical protein